jgi:hypothetical protein
MGNGNLDSNLQSLCISTNMFTLYVAEKDSRLQAPAGKIGNNVLTRRQLSVPEKNTDAGKIQLTVMVPCLSDVGGSI